MADIIVNVTDLNYPPRIDNVTLPGIPRQGDSFQWEADSPATTIQKVTWCGADGGSILIQVI